MLDEHGVEIKIPIDVVGADYFYVPPWEMSWSIRRRPWDWPRCSMSWG